ncbi:AAA family ATPase [Corynebacterium glutamicum]|uniref:AAA family ATPase n=1 Tax=Corynebacterium glutamicum TaxID=1718 RepID=UPI003B594A90
MRHTAKPGDIIIGSDELTNALTGKTESKHHHGGVAKKVSAAAREASINEAIKHRTTTDVWVLVSNLTDREAAKYRRFDAHIIVIDPGYDLAMQRCRDNRPGYKHRLVDSWYNKRSEWPRDAEIINPPLITNHDDDDVLPTTKGATNIHVVTGPPAAGKSTYIRTKWKQGDVLIDFDTIANELAGVEPANHTHPQHIKLITKATRQAAIDAAIKHAGDHTVWIIHSSPSDKLLDHYRTLGATIDVVDPGKDVVMKRCKAERPPEMLKIAAAWYSKQPKPKRASSTQRGYDSAHQRRRKVLLAQMVDGSPCEECGKPRYKEPTKNFDGFALEADHPPGSAQKYAENKRNNPAKRLIHKTCNARGGAWDRPVAKPGEKPESGSWFAWS